MYTHTSRAQGDGSTIEANTAFPVSAIGQHAQFSQRSGGSMDAEATSSLPCAEISFLGGR